MRAAMAAAEVGDDVYGEDPTVNVLEEQVAALFGHEAAVFVPTGTMGNQICLALLVPPADELVCDADAHVVTYEHGGAARYGGISSLTVPGGLVTAERGEPYLRAAGWGTGPGSSSGRGRWAPRSAWPGSARPRASWSATPTPTS